jgi:hypothetical protein
MDRNNQSLLPQFLNLPVYDKYIVEAHRLFYKHNPGMTWDQFLARYAARQVAMALMETYRKGGFMLHVAEEVAPD